MSDWDQERLDRLRAWLADLELVIVEARGARDNAAMEAAETMRDQCIAFITEAEARIAEGK